MIRLRNISVSILCGCLACAPVFADSDEARRALRSALDHMVTRSAPTGGWANGWSAGGEVTFGEHLDVPAGWITVQPPATPKLGEVFLRGARVLNEPRYFDAASRAREALLKLQTAEGGFPHQDDPAAPRGRAGTFDDDVTTGALRFLIAYWQHTGDVKDREAIERVGAFLLAAQYTNGGFPQAHPPRSDHYQRYITFNDGVMVDIVRALLRLRTLLEDERYYDAALRAGECILKLQGGDNETIWAQQYDPDTLEPAWARNFEPPGYTPNESREVCDLLIELHVLTGDERYLRAVERALDWYRTHRGDDGLFARLHEPGTGRPVYGRRDKAEKVYDSANATSGYAWRGNWYPHDAEHALETIRSQGREAYLAAQSKPGARRVSKPQVNAVIGSLDAAGYWAEDASSNWSQVLEEKAVKGDAAQVVHTGTFVRNAGILLDYLEAGQ